MSGGHSFQYPVRLKFLRPLCLHLPHLWNLRVVVVVVFVVANYFLDMADVLGFSTCGWPFGDVFQVDDDA